MLPAIFKLLRSVFCSFLSQSPQGPPLDHQNKDCYVGIYLTTRLVSLILHLDLRGHILVLAYQILSG